MRHSRPLLDSIRWVSAVLVALGHAAALITAPGPASSASLAGKALLFIASARDPSVITFFVLSGYLVGGNLLIRRGSVNWRAYIVARASRIFTVLLPALCLGLIFDAAGLALYPHSPIYYTAWPPGALGKAALVESYTLTNVISTALATTTIFGDEVGTMGPVWSLSLEWLFYFLMPMLVSIAAKVPERFFRVVLCLGIGGVCLGSAAAGKSYVGVFFLIWTAGALARVMIDRDKIPVMVAVICGVLALLIFGISAGGEEFLPMWQLRLLHLGLGFTLALFLSRHLVRERGINKKVDAWMADRSFSLYLVHLPVMAFFTALMLHEKLIPVGGFELRSREQVQAAFGALSVLIVAAGLSTLGFWRLFEKKTPVVKLWLDQLSLAAVPAVPAAPSSGTGS